MKENSPICAIEKPQRMADFKDSPPSINPKVPNKAWPTKIVQTKARMGKAYSAKILGSTNMPTETKKIAPKRFLTGSTNLMIFSASTVSARILPMTKAPKALEKPTLVERTAMPQHNPKATMSKVSLLMSLRTERRKRGMAKIPTINQSTKKKAILMTEPNICSPSGLLPPAMAESITIITIARISSRIKTLITMLANFCCRSPMSSNALYIIVVELIASIPPRKMQSILLQPKLCPTQIPSIIMENTMTIVAMIGEVPILTIFLKEKSRPRENKVKMTPMSAHVLMSPSSMTDMV